jgi:hypothetical protein
MRNDWGVFWWSVGVSFSQFSPQKRFWESFSHSLGDSIGIRGNNKKSDPTVSVKWLLAIRLAIQPLLLSRFGAGVRLAIAPVFAPNRALCHSSPVTNPSPPPPARPDGGCSRREEGATGVWLPPEGRRGRWSLATLGEERDHQSLGCFRHACYRDAPPAAAPIGILQPERGFSRVRLLPCDPPRESLTKSIWRGGNEFTCVVEANTSAPCPVPGPAPYPCKWTSPTRRCDAGP